MSGSLGKLFIIHTL